MSGEDAHDGAGHDHAGHDHAAELKSTPMRRLVFALIVTAGFMFVEAGVGWWSKSLALLADAGHMLADAAALALAIVAQRIAMQQRTRARTYGYRRAEVLAAFGNGVALALTAVWIGVEAVERWQSPPEIFAPAMTVTAVVGLLVNLGSAAMLGAGEGGHNVNTRGALAHVLTDALGSVGAIAAGVLVWAFGWMRADPGISAAIAVLVLWSGWRLVRDTSRVLMEGSPVEIDVEHLEETLRAVPGVVGFHDLHVWSISDGFDVLTVHIVIGRGHHGTDVVAAVARALREKHHLDHCTIQPEPSHDDQLVTLKRRPEPAP
ncbi:MAG TPA: cation diffusion facilitator family transporter [Minicystis sp.]|nr:cation diffusion facilitator family transporter [Minicystis sp.]